MVTAPSAKTLQDRLGVGIGTALLIRAALKSRGTVESKLETCSKLLDGNGVEEIASVDDDQHDFLGLSYVNMGDTYDETIVFDHRSGRYWCCSWGAIVEGNERRFDV